jgi:WD40 repeat protein
VPVHVAQLSPDGKTVVIWSNGTGPTTLWSVATDANVTPAHPHWPSHGQGGSFSPSGNFLATIRTSSHTADIWNLTTGTHVTSFTCGKSGGPSRRRQRTIRISA